MYVYTCTYARALRQIGGNFQNNADSVLNRAPTRQLRASSLRMAHSSGIKTSENEGRASFVEGWEFMQTLGEGAYGE